MRSYVKVNLGVLGRIHEGFNLYRRYKRESNETVRHVLEQARHADKTLESLLRRPVRGMQMLEVGPGQHLIQMSYFALQNEVWGIDLDVVLERISLAGCVRMAKENGWIRTWKTVARKLAGIDRQLQVELAAQLGSRTAPVRHVLQMDAAKMRFPDDHFDVVFSRAVFEHLADPESVISEIRRVLKPGGVMFIALHLFTSDTGCHDARIFSGKRAALPYWAHLQAEYRDSVISNSYLNRLRLDDWKRLFELSMPGSVVHPTCDAGALDQEELRRLRSQGKLMSYSDEELLTVTLEISWRKPLIVDSICLADTDLFHTRVE